MKRFALSSLTALVGCLPLFACGGEESTDPGQTLPPAVASVVVTLTSATLVALGETLQLTASASDANGNTISGKTFTWSSSDESIATVSASGLVTGVANGSITITATTDGVNGTAAIQVEQVGTQLTFTVQPSDALPGGLITPPVEVAIQDALGNVVAGATDAVTVALGTNPGGGTLTGTPTVAAVAGVATFGTLRIDVGSAGYTLIATSGTLTTDTSSAFTISLPELEGVPEFVLSWGGRGTGNGEFNHPFGVATDSNGYVYVVDGTTDNNRVQKFASDGTFVTTWGTEGDAAGEMNGPMGVAVGPDGSVYVADTGNDRIQKFTAEGEFITKWGTLGSSAGEFLQPLALAVGPQGDVYVADPGNERIQKFSPDGTFLKSWDLQGGTRLQKIPMGIAVDAVGNVYVTTANGEVLKFTKDGVLKSTWGTLGFGDGEFAAGAMGITVDLRGNIYVGDAGHPDNPFCRVHKFTSEGVHLASWRVQEDWNGYGLRGLAIQNEDLYVSDTDNSLILKFTYRAQ